MNKFTKHYNLEDKRIEIESMPNPVIFYTTNFKRKKSSHLAHREMNFQQMSLLSLVIIYKHLYFNHNYYN